MVGMAYFENEKYEEAMQELQRLKKFLKKRGINENDFYFGKLCWIEALII